MSASSSFNNSSLPSTHSPLPHVSSTHRGRIISRNSLQTSPGDDALYKQSSASFGAPLPRMPLGMSGMMPGGGVPMGVGMPGGMMAPGLDGGMIMSQFPTFKTVSSFSVPAAGMLVIGDR